MWPAFGFLPLPGFMPLAAAAAFLASFLGSGPSAASSLSLPNGMACWPPKGSFPLLPFLRAFLATRSFLAFTASFAGIFMSAIGL